MELWHFAKASSSKLTIQPNSKNPPHSCHHSSTFSPNSNLVIQQPCPMIDYKSSWSQAHNNQIKLDLEFNDRSISHSHNCVWSAPCLNFTCRLTLQWQFRLPITLTNQCLLQCVQWTWRQRKWKDNYLRLEWIIMGSICVNEQWPCFVYHDSYQGGNLYAERFDFFTNDFNV